MRVQLCVRILAVTSWAAAMCSPAFSRDVDLNAVIRIQDKSSGTTCSATIVTPDGLVISAEHCGCPTMTTAIFRDETTVPLKQLYEPPEKQGRDEAAVLRLIGEGP